MALSKAALKLVKGLMKKKKKGKSYSDQVKPKPKTKAKPKSKGKGPENNTKYNVKGPITRGKKELRKILGEPKNTKAEKVVGKRKVPKKSDKRIEGSGSQSARPKGSKGKTKSQDSPRGSVAGASMKDTKKTHARKVAGVKGTTKDGIPKEMEAEYNATPKGYLRTMWAAVRSKDPVKMRKAFSGSKLTPAMFVRIYNKRR